MRHGAKSFRWGRLLIVGSNPTLTSKLKSQLAQLVEQSPTIRRGRVIGSNPLLTSIFKFILWKTFFCYYCLGFFHFQLFVLVWYCSNIIWSQNHQQEHLLLVWLVFLLRWILQWMLGKNYSNVGLKSKNNNLMVWSTQEECWNGVC